MRIGWLYGNEMNIFGDRGNVIALLQRARWRGLPAEVVTIGVGDRYVEGSYDLLFWGGGQDREQIRVSADLQGSKGAALRRDIEAGVPILAICGGYQLLGDGARPLGIVRVGHGNNGRDGNEGARYRNAIGCYMHGALLPKNPILSDWLLARAVERSGDNRLSRLDDGLEVGAHNAVLQRAVQLGTS